LFRSALTLALIYASPVVAFSHETHWPDSPGYNRADPPNSNSFDKIKFRVVPVPAMKVPESCDGNYRAAMEGSFRRVWSQCQGIGQLEPSDCQRALFERCTRLASDLQAIEVRACTEMLGEKDALNQIVNPENQQASQVSSSDLNRRAAVVTKKVASTLETSAKELAVHKQNALATLNGRSCSSSSAAGEYRRIEKRVVAELGQTQKFVESQAKIKNEAAAQLEKNAEQASSSAAEMKTTGEASSANISTSTTTTDTLVTTVVTKTAYPELAASKEKKINWVPILAVGIPAAAILGGIAYSSMSQNRSGDSSGGPSEEGVSGPETGGGGSDPVTDPVPGGADLNSLNMRIDSSFTDRQRATIATSVEKIPSCYRYKLKGLEVRKANLGGRSSKGSCVAGSFGLGGNLVRLDPSCTGGLEIGVTVHEFFHVLGNRNGNALHGQYKSKVYDKISRCPVSSYAAKHFYEDFAEAGRIVSYPGSGQRNNKSCVNTKLQGLKQILASCQ